MHNAIYHALVCSQCTSIGLFITTIIVLLVNWFQSRRITLKGYFSLQSKLFMCWAKQGGQGSPDWAPPNWDRSGHRPLDPEWLSDRLWSLSEWPLNSQGTHQSDPRLNRCQSRSHTRRPPRYLGEEGEMAIVRQRGTSEACSDAEVKKIS